MPVEPGQMVSRYRLVETIDGGGTGQAWRAVDTEHDREVALRVLPAGLVDNADALVRLQDEARAVAAAGHPNILAIHDVGHSDGVAFVVTELIEGETLRERLLDGPLTRTEVIHIGSQIAQGLSVAHEQGRTHGGLEPERVFLTLDDTVKLIDFGVARASAGYMSPEQAQGQTVDARSDVFSFGAVLYEMLSGRRAFKGIQENQVLSAIVNHEPPPLGVGADGGLGMLIRRCLRKDPAERFASAEELVVALELPTPEEVDPPPASTPRFKPTTAAAWLIAASLVPLALYLVYLWYIKR